MTDPSAGPSKPKGVQRTTKETHPNLPPGLVLDAEGKVCKVCNSWQSYTGLSFKKKTSDTETSTKTKKKLGSGGGFGSMAGLASSSSTTTESKGSTPTIDPSSGFADLIHSKSRPNTNTRPTETITAGSEDKDPRRDCPADTAALGRSTWTFLHTTAAYYPLQAPTHLQTQMKNLLSSLSLLYPCIPCAEDFQEKVKENPPDVSGRLGLSRWLCERHNEVNEKLGKEAFGCDWSNLNKRWKDGPEDGSCD